MALKMDTGSTSGMAPREGSSVNYAWKLTLARGLPSKQRTAHNDLWGDSTYATVLISDSHIEAHLTVRCCSLLGAGLVLVELSVHEYGNSRWVPAK